VLARDTRPRFHRGLSLLLVALVALASLGLSRAPAALATQPERLTGLLMTLAATADDLELTPGGGLVIQVTLTNATGGDLGGLSLRAPIPARSRVVASWFGEPEAGQLPGAVEGTTVSWGGFNLEDGERLGPF